MLVFFLTYFMKFILFLCLPAVAVWLFLTLAAGPLVGFLPGYLKMMVVSPVWFVLSFFVALMGWKRRLGFWVYFLISLLFTPLVGLAAVLLSGKKARSSRAQATPSQRRSMTR